MPSKGRPRALRYNSKFGTRTVVHRTGTAARVIGALEPGVRITGVTAGQFSSIDALEHMVAELGPADVRVTTWGCGAYDVARVRKMKDSGLMRDVRFLVDAAPFAKSPKYAGLLIQIMGAEAFRCASIHSKVNIVRGERGWAVMRSSMGFNKNLRTEQFDIDVDEEVTEFYRGWFDALWEQSGRTQDNAAIIRAVYDRYLANPEEEEDVRWAAPSEPADDGVLLEDIDTWIV